jgi:hypothetical protein
MTEKHCITVRVMTGRTALGRRLAMVAGVDMVVTICGKLHTEVVVPLWGDRFSCVQRLVHELLLSLALSI